MLKPDCPSQFSFQIRGTSLPQQHPKPSQLLEGITHHAQTPFPPTPTPPKFSRFFKVFRRCKKIQIIENTRNIANIVLIFRVCGVKVSKIQVERAGQAILAVTHHHRL